MRTIKNLIINVAPQSVIRALRYYRPFIERLIYKLYVFGVNRTHNYPVYLKLKSKKVSAFPVNDSSRERDRWGQAFCLYNSQVGRETIPLMWADGPIPGNYGDWLSPYIIAKFFRLNVVHVDEVGDNRIPHLMALGSILSLANASSVVVGAGISSCSEAVNLNGRLVSVRGPYTGAHVKERGGKCDSYGDIGFLLRRIYKPALSEKKGILVVRHIQHRSLKIILEHGFRETSIYRARPDDIELFISELHGAELVATSAMHCFITCISYSIPCVLFAMGDWKNSVPGDGVKYRDSLAGVSLPEIAPLYISDGQTFCQEIRKAKPYTDTVPDEALDSIELSLRKAASLLNIQINNEK